MDISGGGGFIWGHGPGMNGFEIITASKQSCEGVGGTDLIDEEKEEVSIKVDEKTLKYFQKRSIETGTSVVDLMKLSLSEVAHLKSF